MKTENNWTNFINWFAIRPKITGLILFSVIAIATIFINVLNNKIQKEEERDEMKIILAEVHQNIEQSLKNCYTSSISLALTLDQNGVPQNFDSISKKLIKSNPILSSVELVPDGIVKYIYPMKGNEAAMNLNILSSKSLQRDALKSIESQKIYFAGPIPLIQGGIGIVGRLPIYHKNKFWGFTAVIIKLETFLKASGIYTIDPSKYYFQVSTININSGKEQYFLPEKMDLSKTYYLSESISDSDLKIILALKKPNSIDNSILFTIFLGFIVAILFGTLVTILLKKPEELELLLKKQETKLLKNELRFKTIFEQATIGFAILEADTANLIEANKKYCDMLGYSFEEIKEIGILNLTHPDDYPKSLEQIKKLDDGEISEFSTEKRYITKSGEIIWVILSLSLLWETKEKPTKYIAFIKEVTKRKKAEDLIRKNELRYKSLIDTIDGIVWEYDLEIMSSTFISKKVETILGYSVEAYSESPTFWEDHVHPKDREFAIALSAKVNKNFTSHDYEYRMITKSGEVIWIRDIMNYVFENDKPVISRGIMIDITKTKEDEKNLNNSLQLVTEQNKRLLNFSYIVSHNLRSHTSNIQSIINLIDSAESQEERNEMMSLLKSVSDSLDETMEHLNEVVNINTNINLLVQPLNLYQYIKKVKDILVDEITENDVTFITNISEDQLIHYNSAYLESILYNLISNAIRYRHPERKPIITIKFNKKEKDGIIEISDNGIGIDLNRNADKIFGMYKTFSNNPDSRGIGLFITKSQINAMHGNITIDSTVNLGSTFKIYMK